MSLDDLLASLERGRQDLGSQHEAALRFNDRIQALLAEPHDGSSADGEVSVSVDGAGTVVDVRVGAGLAVRPTLDPIRHGFAEALAEARRVAGEELQARMQTELGVPAPPAAASTPQAVAQTQAAVQQQTTALRRQFSGTPLEGWIERTFTRAERFGDQEFTGTAQIFTVRLSAQDEVLELTADQLTLREADNHTIGQDLLAAYQDAARRRETARSEVGAPDGYEDQVDLQRSLDQVTAQLDQIRARLGSMNF